ncbi:hybrid sensor histidine kinase/response regulator transcription factor [Lentimicrobium sp. S6]|uniref:hybrid sensor histidine kinase/response regulator transcription factor n=1 Tax=Lentimicrobium sp. S6 TaxID=2735872 RepID=UPI001551CADD|nr:hybrid sensor histidine kinase/response regulator transcription factor [Lentimicrobium sp. S6]NPD45729.1 response regulator [Lentimicrobium sp. S6]
MKNLKPLILLLFALSFILWNSNLSMAQESAIQQIEFNFAPLSKDNPKGDVTCIIQDSVGFIWYGTWQGLYRYDGKEAINFSSKNYGKIGRKISTLHLDKQGMIWVGTYSEGLFTISPQNQKIKLYTQINGVELRNILAISELKNGQVYIGTNDGLFIYKPQTATFQYSPFTNKKGKEVNIRVSAIHEDQLGNIWLGSDHGVFLYNYDKQQVSAVFLEFSEFIHSIISDENGNVWASGIDGIMSFTASKGNWHHPTIDPFGEDFHLEEVHYMMNSGLNSNLIWIGTRTGIYLYDRYTLKSIVQPLMMQDNQRMAPGILSVFEDRNGVLWLGTESGIFKYDQHRKPFYSFKGLKPIGDVSTLSLYSEHEILMSTFSDGLLKANLDEQGQITQVKNIHIQQPGASDVKWSSLYSALTDEDGHIWISSKGYGTFKLKLIGEKNPQAIVIDEYSEESNKGLNDNHVMVLNKDQSGVIWAGTWNHGLLYYDESTNTFLELKNKRSKELKKFPISKISFLKGNKVVLGSRGNGVYILHLNQTQDSILEFEHYKYLQDNSISIGNNYITDIYIDNDEAWFSSEFGLNNYKLEPKEFSYNVVEESSKTVLQSIASVKNDELWISSIKGIYRIKRNKADRYTIRNYNVYDGLAGNMFNANCVLRVKNRLYFGGPDYVISFKPDEIKDNLQDAEVTLTQLKVFNTIIIPQEKFEDDVILDKSLWLSKSIELSHTQNSFSFSFANFNYSSPEKISYAYQLEGYDKDWRYAKLPQAQYTKVRFGKYKLKVKCTNSDGIWSDQITTVDIMISPPWWFTKLAFIIYILIFIGALYLTYYILTYQQRLKVRELEQKKELDIYDSRMRFYTNISHEFRTPLTLILGFVSRMRSLEPQLLKQSDLTEKIDRNAKVLLQLINDIMDLRKLEKDEIRLRKENINPVNFFQSLSEDFIHLYPSKNIELKFVNEIQSAVSIIGDQNRLKSIFNNLLSNAVKFSEGKSQVTVELSLGKRTESKNTWYRSSSRQQKNKQYFVLKISDQGIGMTNKEISQIFERYYRNSHSYQEGITNTPGSGIGLSFVKMLVDLHHGFIEVTSEKNQGSQFSIYFPTAEEMSTEQNSSAAKTPLLINAEKQQIEEEVKKSTQENQNIILIIDDNTEVRELLKEILGDDFKIIEAIDGNDGWQKANDTIPDLIISDVMMPGLDGNVLTEKLKTTEVTSHIPIILLTALPTTEDRIRGLRHGADSYIPKPFDPEHLMVRIEKLIEIRTKLKDKHYKDFVVRPDEEEVQESDPSTIFINKLKELIAENMHNSEYEISNICEEIGISRMQLYRKLKATVGYSANEMIRKMRLHKAAQLLLLPEARVSQVTYDVGFNDIQYFRKCFIVEFGSTPSAYIKEKKAQKSTESA